MHELQLFAIDIVSDFENKKKQGGLHIFEHIHATSKCANPKSELHVPTHILIYNLRHIRLY